MKPAIALASVLLVLAAAAPAGAYDTGPHFEITDDVMTAEGFRGDAVGVAQVNNWFVDFYEQAGKNPFSGHGGFWKRLLAGAIDTENWSDDVIAAAERSHFDSSTSTLFNTVGVTNEWDRLRRSVWTLVREARAQNDRAKLLAVLGMSLHQVQDFYTHTNWIEPVSGLGAEGPGWQSRGFGTSPTWFDVPAPTRDAVTIYTANTQGHPRQHGDWNGDGNTSMVKTMSKDWPGRLHYMQSAIAAHFASRQWVRAVRSWVGDDAFWARAQRYRANQRQLDHDLGGAFGVSLYGGHWQGQGEPLGGTRGPGGSLISLRQAIKHYFQPTINIGNLRGRTQYRRRFEGLIKRLADPTPAGQLGPVPSSQNLQRDTRIVVLRVLRMRGRGLGDPGPDDADMYARVRIDGQPMASAVIHGHDRYSFPDPNEPFTWIKAVPAVPDEGEPVESVEVEVRTGDVRWAGTDDDVYLRLGANLRFPLDKRALRRLRARRSRHIQRADRRRGQGRLARRRHHARADREVPRRHLRRLAAGRRQAARERPSSPTPTSPSTAGWRTTTARGPLPTSCAVRRGGRSSRYGCAWPRTTSSTAATTTATSTRSTVAAPCPSATRPGRRYCGRPPGAAGSAVGWTTATRPRSPTSSRRSRPSRSASRNRRLRVRRPTSSSPRSPTAA